MGKRNYSIVSLKPGEVFMVPRRVKWRVSGRKRRPSIRIYSNGSSGDYILDKQFNRWYSFQKLGRSSMALFEVSEAPKARRVVVE